MEKTPIILLTTSIFFVASASAVDVTWTQGGSWDAADGSNAASDYTIGGATLTITDVQGTGANVLTNVLSSGALAIESDDVGETASRIDAGEGFSWVWDADVTFDSMTFANFAGTNDFALIQSNAWINLNISESPQTNYTYNKSAGSFKLYDQDTFNFETITGADLALSAGTAIVFSNEDNVGEDGAYVINGFSFTVVPEPGSYALLGGLFALSFVMVRRRY